MARRLCGLVSLVIGCLLLTGCPPAEQGDVGLVTPASTSTGWGVPGSTAGWGMPGSTAGGWGVPESTSPGWAMPHVTESSAFVPIGAPDTNDASG